MTNASELPATAGRDELVEELLRWREDSIRGRLLERAAARIQADAATIAGMQWQPIETAPDCEDGVLICDASKPNPAVGVARLMDGKWRGASLEWGLVSEAVWPTPTHWMPLPNPPALKGGDHG